VIQVYGMFTHKLESARSL